MTDFTITTKVSPQRVCDMFAGAFEGGSNYWIGRALVELVTPNYDDVANPDNIVWWGRVALYEQPFQIRIEDPEGGDDHITIDNAAVEKGLTLMAEKHARHYADLASENDDAETHDVFLQLCAFGEVVYG